MPTWKNYKCNNTDIRVKGRNFSEASKKIANILCNMMDNITEDSFKVRKNALQGAWKTFSIQGIEVNARNPDEAARQIVHKINAICGAVISAPEACITELKVGRPRKPRSNVL